MDLVQLYPQPGTNHPLRGLYLQECLHRPAQMKRPFVYANFVMSLDGRIALQDGALHPYIPKSLTSPGDWRLFLELEAQADCLITHAGYLRSLKAGRLGDILTIGSQPEAEDLRTWRTDHGLSAQPAVVVVSGSLDFEMPEALFSESRQIYIATGARAPSERIARWRAQGFEVLICGGEQAVEGRPLVDALTKRGHRSQYLIAGPRMLETMLKDRVLSRLYLTISLQLLGGKSIHTLISGPAFAPAAMFTLRSLYYGAGGAEHPGEWFASFAPAWA